MPWFYYVVRFLTRCFTLLLITLFLRFEATGKENVPRGGPLIVVMNHLSLADPPLLGITIPRRMVFMAKEELFRYWLLGYFVRTLGAFPVRRGKPARQAIAQAEEVLSRGLALAIFPEGTRSRSGVLKEAFPGAALIAWRSGAPLLPVAISGSEVISGLRWIFRRPRVRLSIGKPFYLKPHPSETDKPQLKEATQEIMERIAALLPIQYRGRYRERVAG